MAEKKNSSHDLHNKSIVFFSIGLMLTLLVIVSAFEMTGYYEENEKVEIAPQDILAEETIEIPPTDIVPPPPPPVPQQPEIIEVPDEEEIEELENVIDADLNENTTPPPPAPPAPPKNTGIAPPPPPKKEKVNEVFTFAEQMPEFPGGTKAFAKFLRKNLKYPSQARRMGVEGRVYVQFVVHTDGKLTDIKVLKGIGGGCDEEAVRVLKKAPKWVPGKQRGNPVTVKMNVPIRFKLGR